MIRKDKVHRNGAHAPCSCTSPFTPSTAIVSRRLRSIVPGTTSTRGSTPSFRREATCRAPWPARSSVCSWRCPWRSSGRLSSFSCQHCSPSSLQPVTRCDASRCGDSLRLSSLPHPQLPGFLARMLRPMVEAPIARLLLLSFGFVRIPATYANPRQVRVRCVAARRSGAPAPTPLLPGPTRRSRASPATSRPTSLPETSSSPTTAPLLSSFL